MEVNVLEDKRLVTVYLTKAEHEDPEIQEELKAMYSEYRAQGFLVVNFISGKQDLYENTRELLIRNKRRFVELQRAKEKQRMAQVMER